MRRLDHKHVVGLYGVAGLVFRKQNLVQLFPRPDADAIDLAVRRDRLGHIQQLHAWNFWDEDFSAVHLLDTSNNKAHALVQSDPEAGHSRIGNSDSPARALLHEYRDHASATPDYIAVTRATETSVLLARISVGLHEHFFRAE